MRWAAPLAAARQAQQPSAVPIRHCTVWIRLHSLSIRHLDLERPDAIETPRGYFVGPIDDSAPQGPRSTSSHGAFWSSSVAHATCPRPRRSRAFRPSAGPPWYVLEAVRAC